MLSNGAKVPETFCILCPSFHGATVLSVVLGNHSRVLSLGDTIARAQRGRCGCGELRSDCAFWSRLQEAWGEPAGGMVIPATPVLLPWPRVNRAATIAATTLATKFGLPFRIQPFERACDCYFRVCRETSDFDVFVDGYKSLSRYTALKAAKYPVRGVIHLVRDPRAYAASAKRRGHCPVAAARGWAGTHSRITRVTGWLRERTIVVRHEDFCLEPEVQLARLQDWLGVAPVTLLVPPGPDHHWIGSITVRGFDGSVRPQRPWQSDLTECERNMVESLTAKQAAKIGYAF